MITQTTVTENASGQPGPSPLPSPAPKSPAKITALSVIALCAVAGLAYILIPRVEAEQAKAATRKLGEDVDARQKDKVLYQCGMIGLALKMYAQDNEGYLPPPKCDIKAALSTRSAFKNSDPGIVMGPWQNSVTGESGSDFIYTLPSLTKMDSSGKNKVLVEVGYKDLTPGKGRVVIYSNGATQWSPSK